MSNDKQTFSRQEVTELIRILWWMFISALFFTLLGVAIGWGIWG